MEEKLARVLRLLDMKLRPEDEEYAPLLIRLTERLVQEKGEDWVIRYRGLLKDQWEVIMDRPSVLGAVDAKRFQQRPDKTKEG